MKLNVGTTIPDITLHTHRGEHISLGEVVQENNNTVVLFLRYYGCTVCQLDLMEYKRRYNDFKDKGFEVVIVLQSTPEIVSEGGVDLPYIVACDPKLELYQKFEIYPAKSKLGLVSFGTIRKVKAAKRAGFTHGTYEGEELQLPALCIINQQGRVTYSRYAKNLADIPSIDKILTLV